MYVSNMLVVLLLSLLCVCCVFASVPCPLSVSSSYDYIVVGSGAGGGVVASRLAHAGFNTLLIDAGKNIDNINTTVPAFHGASTEDPEIRWDYFVQHFDRSDAYYKKDDKFVDNSRNNRPSGILYPRASTIGGCTQHNAMITMRPFDSDWSDLQQLTGDDGWSPASMKKRWRNMEQCQYRKPENGLNFLSAANDHGYQGWLPTRQPDVTLALKSADAQLVSMLSGLPFNGEEGLPINLHLDPNQDDAIPSGKQGLHLQAAAIDSKGKRAGAKTMVKSAPPNKLTVLSSALVHRILFDSSSTPQAIGVEYEVGDFLYQASPKWNGRTTVDPSKLKRVYARREVILSAGTFSTPQILIQSGVGPKDQLTKFNIKPVTILEGVGKNLQDRYEVGVVNKMKNEFSLLKDCTFNTHSNPSSSSDPCIKQWLKNSGPYTTNGCVAGVSKCSSQTSKNNPDLYVFGLPGYFRGYYPNWFSTAKNFFTWAVLKARSRNNRGTVELASSSPYLQPSINFRNFAKGEKEDIDAVVDGIKYARSLASSPLASVNVDHEVVPGKQYQTDAQLREFVKVNAWGHHACCTAKIGKANDPLAVLDSKFRVYGVKRLRVVDASVFPTIPGFFIVTPIYMAAEKAAENIIDDANTCSAAPSTPSSPGKSPAGGNPLNPSAPRTPTPLPSPTAIPIVTLPHHRLESPPLGESETIASIQRLFTGFLQDAHNKKTWLRQAHVKQHGCVVARLDIASSLPASLRVGVFQPSASYNGVIRFSSGAGRGFTRTDEDFSQEADWKPDNRGLALKIFDVPGERKFIGSSQQQAANTHDFMFTTTPTPFVKDAAEAFSFFSSVGAGELSIAKFLANPKNWGIAKLYAQNSLTGPTIKSLLHAKYFGNLPMAMGKKHAIKLELHPCDTNVWKFMLPQNQLHRLLLAYSLSQNSACFKVMAQEYVSEAKTPIEDSTAIWDVPYVEVGKLTLPQQTLDITGEYCDALSFNSAHAIPAHQPIGPIHRVRASVYNAMGYQRCAYHKKQYREPLWQEVLDAKKTLNGFTLSPAHVFAVVEESQRIIKQKPYLAHFSPK